MTSNAFSFDNVRRGMLHFHTAAQYIIVTRSHYGNTAPEGRQTEGAEEGDGGKGKHDAQIGEGVK